MHLIGASLLLFAATNVDDLLLLVVIFSDGRRSYRPTAILAGQILGFTLILVISLLGFWTGLVVPSSWMACLGLFPLALGVRQLIRLLYPQQGGHNDSASGYFGHLELDSPQAKPALSSTSRGTILKMASLTLANGSDNISVYLPLFGRLTAYELLITLPTFFVALCGLWLLAQWITTHRRFRRFLQFLGPRLSPVVLILLGFWLLKDSVLWPMAVFSTSALLPSH